MNFPIALELASKWCLVVGNGAEAEQRVRQFKARGAHVRVLYTEAPTSIPADEQLRLEPGAFAASHVDGVWLAVLTERDPELAARMKQVCDAQRIWFCAVDQPEFNSFSHVAQVSVEPITIAISSAGRAPLLSRRVREGLEQLFDTDAVRSFFASIAALRASTPPAQRRAVLTRALEGFTITGKVTLPEGNSLPPDSGSNRSSPVTSHDADSDPPRPPRKP